MSATTLSFPVGPGRLELDGPRRYVRHPRRPLLDYAVLDHERDRLLLDGRAMRWLREDESTDSDEIETHYRLDDPAGGELELVVRHSFGPVWTQRYVLINHKNAARTVGRLAVAVEPGPGALGWSLTAGAEAFWLLTPGDGDGPVLAATLQSGEVLDYADGAWRTPELRLAPGARYVLQWQTDWYRSAAGFERQRASVLPRRTEVDLHVPCEITGADTAVVVSDEVVVTREGEVSLALADRPGRHRAELRSATGTVTTWLSWVAPLPDWIGRWSRNWLDAERTAAGIARLPGSAAGLVVQRALVDRLLDQPDPGVEAVELLAARLLTQDALSATDIAFLAGEALRTGDPDCAEGARQALLDQPAAGPGIGLAATRVGLAEVSAGRSVAAVSSKLQQLRATSDGDPGSADLVAVAARLELGLLTGQRGGPVDHQRDSIRALGARVGFGLPGAPMHPDRVADLGYAVAVLGLISDGDPESARGWLEPPPAVADQLRRHCLSELAEQNSGETDVAATLSWLLLSQPLT